MSEPLGRLATPDRDARGSAPVRPGRDKAMETQAPPHSAIRHSAVRLFFGSLARAYSRVRAEGLEHLPAGPSVLCFTHQSWADPLYMFAAMPSGSRLYFFGPEQEEMRRGTRNRLMRWSGAVVPYRPGKRGLVAATARVQAILSCGGVVAIAGEGRIHAGEGIVLPLRDGAAYLALRAGVPIVPVSINGTSWLGFRRVVRIRVGEPITAKPRTVARPAADEVSGLTALTQTALEALVADYPEQPLPGPIGRKLTELFNDWPDGLRPPAQSRKSEFEAFRTGTGR